MSSPKHHAKVKRRRRAIKARQKLNQVQHRPVQPAGSGDECPSRGNYWDR